MLGKKKDKGFEVAMKTLDGGRISVIQKQAVGLTQGAIDATVPWQQKTT